MIDIPFYPNHPNGMYCVLAVYRSLFEYFLDEKYSFEDLEKMARAQRGKAVWHLLLDIYLAKKGVDVINIEKIDYEKLRKEKEKYLKDLYDVTTAKYYIEESNISDLYDIIPEYLKHISHITKEPAIEDIDALLGKGYIIGAEVNSRILNKKAGFSMHYVLIQRGEYDTYIVHDPGLPPIQNRKVSRQDLVSSLANEITGFKK